MKKYAVLLILFLFCSCSVSAQNTKGDSLRTGRVCKLVLYNGFQTEGKITERKNDTLTFETDITKLFIPVKDIKLVLNPDVELSDLEDIDTSDHEKLTEPLIKIDTTDECDIYFDNKSVLKDVRLVVVTDSTLKTIRNERSKIINISGIRKIVFKASAPFGKGYFFGSLVGFAIGFIPTAFSGGGGHPDFSGFGFGVLFGLACSIPTGLIGGVIGVLTAYDDIYLYDAGINPKKIKNIKYAIDKHIDK